MNRLVSLRKSWECTFRDKHRVLRSYAITYPIRHTTELFPCPPIDSNESSTLDINTFNIDVICNEISTLYYDGSKTQDGIDANYIMMDQLKKKKKNL